MFCAMIEFLRILWCICVYKRQLQPIVDKCLERHLSQASLWWEVDHFLVTVHRIPAEKCQRHRESSDPQS